MNFIPAVQLLLSPKMRDNKNKAVRSCLVSLLRNTRMQIHLNREVQAYR